MEKNITLTVRSKTIIKQCPLHWSSNTVDYITATFDLDDEWSECDVVKAVWSGRRSTIVTLLDANNTCVVPHEVLATVGKVNVNLTGVVYGDGEEFTRITTYPFNAITIDAPAMVDGDETAPVTPSQFDQFVQAVISETEKVTGMTAEAETLPAGSDATASYSDGVLALGIPRGDTGERGEQGVPGERGERGERGETGATGAKGDTGNGIASITKTGTVGLVDTYTILFTDGTSTTFTVTNGEDGSTNINWGDIHGNLANQTDLNDALSALNSNLNAKITNPSGGTAGQVLKKTASGEEWANESGGGVQDVQVAGTSVVSGGVANVPMASALTPGVVVSGSIAITGTTPIINAVPGVRYVCGEVSTLDITLPASGIVDVTFESGSTPTVLTVTPPTGVTLKWANGFDPTSLEANTTYEINIMDGIGVAVGVSA